MKQLLPYSRPHVSPTIKLNAICAAINVSVLLILNRDLKQQMASVGIYFVECISVHMQSCDSIASPYAHPYHKIPSTFYI